MSEVFLKIVNMSISASWIVFVVLLLRLFLKKAPKWITVLLWGIVGIRLIFPFSIESVMSLIPSAETVNPAVLISEVPEINTGFEVVDNIINPIIGETVTTIEPEKAVNTFKLSVLIFSKVWLIGIALMLIYALVSYLRVRKKVSTAVRIKDNIYQSENVVSPFVLGVIKPKIYLPFNMSKQDVGFVIAHEEAHIKRKDYLWKPFGFIILTLHWFNPLMWLGYALLCRDIEIACDEKVVKELSNDKRADYSQALLNCSVNRRMIAACPLAFGEVGVRERVRGVLNYKKPAFWIIVVSIIVIVITSVCLLTNPRTYHVKDLDDRLQVFLDMQVTKHNSSDESKDNFVTVSYDLMKVDNSGSETTVYAWILYLEYSYDNGVLTKESGSHIPTVITVQKNGSSYELVEYWIPRDGSYYVDDIKEKFPMYLWPKAMYSQRSIDKQIAECEQMAKEYFCVSGIHVGDVSSRQSVVLANNSYKFKSDKDMATLSLSTIDNTGSFSYSLLSSYMAYGTYEDDGKYIVLKTNDGKFKYTFKKENDTMKFVAEESSELPSYAYSSGAKSEICVPDGAIFEKIELEFVNVIDSIIFDIDKDGKDENCVLGYGPTSGLFTFTLYVDENGKHEYFNIYQSPVFNYLSFDVQDGILRLKGMTQGDNPETKYFDFVVDGSNILIKNGNEAMGYWGEQGLKSPYAPASAKGLDDAISVVLNEKYRSKEPDGLLHIENYVLFGNELISGLPQIGSNKSIEKERVYLLVYHMKYTVNSTAVEEYEGNFVPTVITFSVDENGNYSLDDYITVNNNEKNYVKNVEKYFPEGMWKDALNTEKYAEELIKDSREKATAYLESTK